jgi:arylsulfatase A-like enzyme
LEEQGLLDRTIIVLWSDHGYQLGENGEWTKHDNFELSTRVPLFVSAPGVTGGTATRALVELVDLFPTLCELSGLRPPPGLEGSSFVPLLQRPELPWKAVAFSQFPWPWNEKPKPRAFGRTVRSERYRYTEWQRDGEAEPAARELYDYGPDGSEQIERVNLAGRAEVAEIEKALRAQLHAGWRAASPPQPKVQ